MSASSVQTKMANNRKRLTMREIADIIDNEWSDDDDEVHTVTVLPPENVDYVTDEEILDEEEIVLNDVVSAVNEVAGTLEYETRGDIDGNVNLDEPDTYPFQTEVVLDQVDVMSTESNEQPSTSSAPRGKRQRLSKQNDLSKGSRNYGVTYRQPSSFKPPKWVKNLSSYDIQPKSEPLQEVQQLLFEQLKDHGPVELFFKFFDEEVIQHIVEQSSLYATQQNAGSFEFSTVLLKRFIGILIISGYHTLPAVSDYWSTNVTLGVPIVKQTMSRNKFREIKRFVASL